MFNRVTRFFHIKTFEFFQQNFESFFCRPLSVDETSSGVDAKRRKLDPKPKSIQSLKKSTMLVTKVEKKKEVKQTTTPKQNLKIEKHKNLLHKKAKSCSSLNKSKSGLDSDVRQACPSNQFKTLDDYADFIQKEAKLDDDDVISFKQKPNPKHSAKSRKTLDNVRVLKDYCTTVSSESQSMSKTIVNCVKKLAIKKTKPGVPASSKGAKSKLPLREQERSLKSSASTSHISKIGKHVEVQESISLCNLDSKSESTGNSNDRRRSSRRCVLEQTANYIESLQKGKC